MPEADHALFRDRLSTVHEEMQHKPLEFLYERFSEYIEDRRREPRNDILTGLATATFPDGSTPEVGDAALIAAARSWWTWLLLGDGGTGQRRQPDHHDAGQQTALGLCVHGCQLLPWCRAGSKDPASHTTPRRSGSEVPLSA